MTVVEADSVMVATGGTSVIVVIVLAVSRIVDVGMASALVFVFVQKEW